MPISERLLWILLAIGVVLDIVFSFVAYSFLHAHPESEFEGAVSSLESLVAEESVILSPHILPSLSSHFVDNETQQASDQAQKQGDTIRRLGLPEASRGQQTAAARFADEIASTSERISASP